MKIKLISHKKLIEKQGQDTLTVDGSVVKKVTYTIIIN